MINLANDVYVSNPSSVMTGTRKKRFSDNTCLIWSKFAWVVSISNEVIPSIDRTGLFLEWVGVCGMWEV